MLRCVTCGSALRVDERKLGAVSGSGSVCTRLVCADVILNMMTDKTLIVLHSILESGLIPLVGIWFGSRDFLVVCGAVRRDPSVPPVWLVPVAFGGPFLLVESQFLIIFHKS